MRQRAVSTDLRASGSCSCSRNLLFCFTFCLVSCRMMHAFFLFRTVYMNKPVALSEACRFLTCKTKIYKYVTLLNWTFYCIPFHDKVLYIKVKVVWVFFISDIFSTRSSPLQVGRIINVSEVATANHPPPSNHQVSCCDVHKSHVLFHGVQPDPQKNRRKKTSCIPSDFLDIKEGRLNNADYFFISSSVYLV